MTDTVKGNPMFPKTEGITPPDWVLLEAAKRCNFAANLGAGYYHSYSHSNPAFRALCDMIERYEQPPQDRKILCAREAVSTAGDGWTRADVAVRAIELWEKGYGER